MTPSADFPPDPKDLIGYALVVLATILGIAWLVQSIAQ